MIIEDNVGERIRKGIKRQKMFSELTGVSQATISRIEAGTQKPSMETLVAFSEVLNVSVEELIKYAKNTNSEEESVQDNQVEINLDDLNTLMKYDFKVNGESLTFEEYKGMIVFVQTMKSINKNS